MIRIGNIYLNLSKISTLLSVILITGGFTFLQRYVNHTFMLGIGFMLLGLISRGKNTIEVNKIIYLILLVYIFINMIFSYDSSRMTFLSYFLPILFSVLYIVSNVEVNETMNIFKLSFYMSIAEAITIYLSVIMNNFITKYFGFLYRSSVKVDIAYQAMRGKYTGYIGEKALAAYLLALGIAYQLATIRDDLGGYKKKNIIFIIFLLVAMLFTSKRTMFFTSVIMIAVTFFLGVEREYRIKYIAGIAIAAIIVFLVVRYVPAARITFERFSDVESYETMNGRTDLWTKAIECFKKRPLIGIGYGAYKYVTGQTLNAHCSYLQLLSDTGVVGVCIWLIIFVTAIFKAIKNIMADKSSYNMLVMNILIMTFIYSITGNVFFSYQLTLPFFLVIAMQNSCASKTDMEDL